MPGRVSNLVIRYLATPFLEINGCLSQWCKTGLDCMLAWSSHFYRHCYRAFNTMCCYDDATSDRLDQYQSILASLSSHTGVGKVARIYHLHIRRLPYRTWGIVYHHLPADIVFQPSSYYHLWH